MPASPIDDDEALAAGEQALDHRPLVGLQVGPRVRSPGRRSSSPADGAVVGRRHPLGAGERPALKLPDPLGGEAVALGALADRGSPPRRRGRRRPAPRPRAAGAPSGRFSATAWIASRRSKWEAWAVTARSTCARSRLGRPAPGRSRPKRRADRLAVEADLLAPWTRQRSRRLSLVRSRSLALRVARVATWRARAEASGPAASRISARRVEKARRCSSVEALDLGDAVADLLPAATPSRRVSSWRRWAS